MLRYILEDLKISYEDIEIKEKYGDICFNVNKLSKKYKVEKQIFENELLKLIKSSNFIKSFDKVNDFFNIFLNWPKLLVKFLNDKIIEEKIIANKILIEHTSANPNKALHIGHLRNSCIGDCLYRFLKKLGNKVFVANYVDDTGAQMAELLIAFKYLNKDINTSEKFDLYCSKLYTQVNKLLENDENLRKLKNIIVKELEIENSFTSELNKQIVKKVIEAQLQTLWYFDIYFDFINKESDILSFGLWEETFEKLKKLNKIEFVENGEEVDKLDEYSSSITKRKVGTYVIKSKNTNLVLIKSDGTLTYLAKDIAYAFWKHSLLSKSFLFSFLLKQPNGKELYQTDKFGREIKDFENFDMSINVIGREQSENQYVIENLIKELTNKKYIYYSYGLVFISKKVANSLGIEVEKDFLKMSGRKGLVVNVDDLIKKFEEKVRETLEKRNIKDDELVKKIVKSCLRYEMVKLDKNKDLIFDFDEALRLDGNTALYLMYTYARINSIVRNLEKIGELKINDFDCELNEEEKNLAKEILKFDSVINSVAKTLEINQLANYIYELSKKFNVFYEKCRIIDEKDKDKKELRKVLLLITKNILENAFDILGIEKVERI
ncbi:MAG: arginine--tRNA ligase [Candidatus Aenigmatarchaeota archaeon]